MPASELALLQAVKNSVLCHVSKTPPIRLVKYVLPFEAWGTAPEVQNKAVGPTSSCKATQGPLLQTPGLRELLPASFPSSVILIIYWLTLPHHSQASLPLAQTSYNTLEEDEGIS